LKRNKKDSEKEKTYVQGLAFNKMALKDEDIKISPSNYYNHEVFNL